ncbi:MAG: outer membrane protein assembly factor BamD [Treponema sp.]|nr:outer membrane protein assembly factor BamD [Treponema sp.]
MIQKGCVFLSCILGLLVFSAGVSAAQENAQTQYMRRFLNGNRFYNELRMNEAAAEFRRAQEIAATPEDRTQALYWVILAELALADYGSAIRDMEELERTAPNSSFAKDMVYHRARAYFNQGYFEDALLLFKRFSDGIPSDDTEKAEQKAAAFFWMGECLYSMGQFDEAQRFYAWVISRYPFSPRVEVSSYRLDLIKQKKIEAELLSLLRWSHEESLKNNEEYLRKLRTYEHTLNIYSRRIAELQGTNQSPRPAEAGNAGGIYQNSSPVNQQSQIAGNAAQAEPEEAGIMIDSFDIHGNEELRDRAVQLEENIQRLIMQYDTLGGLR